MNETNEARLARELGVPDSYHQGPVQPSVTTASILQHIDVQTAAIIKHLDDQIADMQTTRAWVLQCSENLKQGIRFNETLRDNVQAYCDISADEMGKIRERYAIDPPEGAKSNANDPP